MLKQAGHSLCRDCVPSDTWVRSVTQSQYSSGLPFPPHTQPCTSTEFRSEPLELLCSLLRIGRQHKGCISPGSSSVFCSCTYFLTKRFKNPKRLTKKAFTFVGKPRQRHLASSGKLQISLRHFLRLFWGKQHHRINPRTHLMELQLASTKTTRGTSSGFSLKANCCILNLELLTEVNPESNLGPEQGSNPFSLLNKPLSLRQENL